MLDRIAQIYFTSYYILLISRYPKSIVIFVFSVKHSYITYMFYLKVSIFWPNYSLLFSKIVNLIMYIVANYNIVLLGTAHPEIVTWAPLIISSISSETGLFIFAFAVILLDAHLRNFAKRQSQNWFLSTLHICTTYVTHIYQLTY